MVNGWNKFCFTGGIVEISAKLPGKHNAGGLWPAMWLLGNMARATYVGSSNNVWPWSYNTCSKAKQSEQKFSACNRVNHFDLHAFQGRGVRHWFHNITLFCRTFLSWSLLSLKNIKLKKVDSDVVWCSVCLCWNKTKRKHDFVLMFTCDFSHMYLQWIWHTLHIYA